jgi:hypothetical protein
VNTTMRVPKVIASSVARIAASTEAQPLMPQAQGTRSGAPGPRTDRLDTYALALCARKEP